MEWYHIYFLTRAVVIHDLLDFLLFMTGAGASLSSLFYALIYTEICKGNLRNLWLLTKKLSLTFLIFACLYTSTPDRETVVAMYILPKISNSDFTDELKDVPSDMLKLLDHGLREWLSEDSTAE